MKVGTNLSAIIANNSLKRTDDKLSATMERLSSGLKVNHAKDNPAGIAIAKRMNSQISGLGVGNANASDGISVVQTADGAMSEITDIIQRMNELAVQAANGTMTDDDRSYLESEMKQLKEEITRIATQTDFNGQKLMDGTFDLKGYTSDSNVKVAYYSDEVEVKKYLLENITTGVDEDGNTIVTGATPHIDPNDENSFPADAYVSSIVDDIVTIKAGNGFEVKLQAKGDASQVELDMTGIGAVRMQIGANEGQVLEIRIPQMSLKLMGIANTSVATQEDAQKALGEISDALQYVSQARARLGAYENRLEHSTKSLDVTIENMTGAYSRIMDLDMATEMTTYTTQQVLSQAGTAILAQANERPQQVLQLLQ